MEALEVGCQRLELVGGEVGACALADEPGNWDVFQIRGTEGEKTVHQRIYLWQGALNAVVSSLAPMGNFLELETQSLDHSKKFRWLTLDEFGAELYRMVEDRIEYRVNATPETGTSLEKGDPASCLGEAIGRCQARHSGAHHDHVIMHLDVCQGDSTRTEAPQ
jgi:hypothetical protein